MKKEVLVAILVGLGIGLIFTYGIWLANKSLKQAGVKTVSLKPTTVPTPSPSPASNFSLSAPEDNLLTNNPSLNISGLREPGSILIILTETSQYILPASSSPSFSHTISLDAGFNRLKIISLDTSNQTSTLNRLVTYSTTASLFSSVSPSPKVSPSSAVLGSLRDSVKEKVDQQIAEIKKNTTKKAYLDQYSKLSDRLTITAETIIKLKNNSEGTTKDLKADDYLLAMGDADAAGNLTVRRILVIDKPKDDPRQIVAGTVTAFTSKTLTIDKTTLNISKDTVFQPSKYKFKDVDPGFKLIAVYTPTSTPLIYIVSEK